MVRAPTKGGVALSVPFLPPSRSSSLISLTLTHSPAVSPSTANAQKPSSQPSPFSWRITTQPPHLILLFLSSSSQTLSTHSHSLCFDQRPRNTPRPPNLATSTRFTNLRAQKPRPPSADANSIFSGEDLVIFSVVYGGGNFSAFFPAKSGSCSSVNRDPDRVDPYRANRPKPDPFLSPVGIF